MSKTSQTSLATQATLSPQSPHSRWLPFAVLAWLTASCFLVPSHATDTEPADFSGPIKIAKLLWNANSASAAKTLESSFEKAIARGHLAQLGESLTTLQAQTADVLAEGEMSDARFSVSVAATLLAQSASGNSKAKNAVRALDGEVIESGFLAARSPAMHGVLLRVWLDADRAAAMQYFTAELQNASNTKIVAQYIDAALDADRTQTATRLLDTWHALPTATQQIAIEPLTASTESMTALVSAVAAGAVDKQLVNPNQLQKWLQTENKALHAEIEKVWGTIRTSGDSDRPALVAKTVARLQSGVQGSASRGQQVFARVCSQCHVLHNEGYEVGPNITGNGRGNLAQLVSNVLDPSLVIGEAFQAKTVLTVDGNVVSGLVAAEDDTYLKLKLQGGKVEEFHKVDDIEIVKASSKSLMPEGVEAQMAEQELFDLFAYLCLLKPLTAVENELIPGTPADFVQP